MPPPIFDAPSLARITGRSWFALAALHAQPTGSFKYWGARERLIGLSLARRRRGVVAFSSGNFAQALAAAGSATGIPVTVVMPVDAPAEKVQAARGLGAEVVHSPIRGAGREAGASELASQIAEDRGLTLLHPFDDEALIAGHAQMLRRVFAELARQDRTPDVVVCPVGGGGLAAGTVVALDAAGMNSTLMVVEPVGFDGLGRSLRCGTIVAASGTPGTICDGMMALAPGRAPYEIIADRATRASVISATTSESSVRRAMRRSFTELKLVLEPSGATALAAALEDGVCIAGGSVLVLATGGNVSPERFQEILSAE